MANQFVNLPAPAANGSGAWVNTSTFGAIKTITAKGNGSVFEPFVTIEGSNELVPVHAFPVASFNSPTTEFTEDVVCHWMRATVSNYKGGGAPTVELGGTDDGSTFAQLAVPAGNGDGAGTDVSGLGLFKTVQVGGPFRGQLNIEVSEDGGVTYSTAFSFALGGKQSATIAADFMRVSRNGVPTINPGLPVVWVGGANPTGGGGGGSIDVQQDEVDVVNPATTLDFQTPGTLVTAPGGGVAKIWATLFPVVSFTLSEGGPPLNLVAGKTNLIDTSESGGTGNLPAANSVPNGVPCIVKLFNLSDDEGATTGQLAIAPAGSDTVDGENPIFTFLEPDQNGESLIFVSDGVSNWSLVSIWLPTPSTPGATDQAFYAPVDHLTTPNSFAVALPVAMADDQYVVGLELQCPTSDDIVGLAILSKTTTTITLCATSNFADASTIHISVKEKTGGP